VFLYFSQSPSYYFSIFLPDGESATFHDW
jgi:hypothetical protein